MRKENLGLERKLRTKKKPIIGKRKILVMDDEEMVRDVTAAMLSKLGYEVEVAVGGVLPLTNLKHLDHIQPSWSFGCNCLD
jgi:PleD family two-component response regulator